MSFHDVLFPVDIALDSEGGPTRRTEVTTLVNGHEERNSPHAGSRRVFNAGYGVKSLSDIEDVISFFEARHGRLYGFRFRDPFDFKSAKIEAPIAADDQVLGFGDGQRSDFQLIKTYTSGEGRYERAITKPVAASVLVSVNNVVQTQGSDYTIDDGQGVINFTSAPQQGEVVSAGFIFDTPVRFDTDELRINLAAFKAGDIPSIPMIEVFV